MRTTRSGSTAGSGQASLAKAPGSRPSAAASGMPWTFPVGEVAGVFRSPCASSQRTAPGPRTEASPPSVPSAIEWSPPSTIGVRPSSTARATARAMRSQVSLIWARKRACGLPLAVASATTVSTLPQSSHAIPSSCSRSSSPA